jgi:adenine phosphoribosyltransferase
LNRNDRRAEATKLEVGTVAESESLRNNATPLFATEFASPTPPGKTPMAPADMLDLTAFVRDVPDFPKPGILFRDITPLLASPIAFQAAIQRLADRFRDDRVDMIVAAEARGVIFAAPLALELNAGFVPVRKPGKLPFDTHAFHYELEYGTDTLEIHVDGVAPGQRVLVVDDLLATGGTVEACCKLLEHTGAVVVGCGFLIELDFLNGSRRLAPHPTFSLIHYG